MLHRDANSSLRSGPSSQLSAMKSATESISWRYAPRPRSPLRAAPRGLLPANEGTSIRPQVRIEHPTISKDAPFKRFRGSPTWGPART
jgi:hypothetical protein